MTRVYTLDFYSVEQRTFIEQTSRQIRPTDSTRTAQKVKFSVKHFFRKKCDQIHRKFQTWSFMENFIFCAVFYVHQRRIQNPAKYPAAV